MMPTVTEASFVERRQIDWHALQSLVERSSALASLRPDEASQMPTLYRNLCADLARAEASAYSQPLVSYLHALVARAHALIYATEQSRMRRNIPVKSRLLDPFLAFPRAVRRRKVAVLLATLLFFVPFAVGLCATLYNPSFAQSFMPEDELRALAEAYIEGFDAGRALGQDATMAGFYVNNNVGIALRCFALGVFGGIGSAYYLVYNGIATGTIFGYVSSQGAAGNILTFTMGHSTLELGAIVLAGGAGLSLGWSLIAPGNLTRAESIRKTGSDVITIVMGAAVMLFMAAAVEGFWSSSSIPALVKRIVGGFNFVVIIAYLIFVGRKPAEGST